ncbi:ABC transporter permease [Rhodococcus opacus]|uniref:ABC transporter permease n=1 Tax=Rhodococcus opacus TaxID=37919 RepID=UPI001C4480D1|nr:ABC transporter permease [Rhodococcus opacus]MBV6756982.1 ABC transporter permease [Rhodococcus opacus]
MIRRTARAAAVELWLPLVAVAGAWVATTRSESFYFPPLQQVAHTYKQMWLFDRIGSDAVPSVRNFLFGLVIATVIGIGAGLVLALRESLYDAALPVFEFMRSVPGIVLVPIGLVLMGVGDEMKIAVIAYGTIWPILLGTIDGVRSLDPLVRDMMRSYHIPFHHRLLRVVLPGASPQILAGARISVALGVVLIIASEYVASTHGIGYVQLQAERTFAIPEMWSALLLLGILGYTSNVVFRGIERYLLRWYYGLRKAGQGGSAS